MKILLLACVIFFFGGNALAEQRCHTVVFDDGTSITSCWEVEDGTYVD